MPTGLIWPGNPIPDLTKLPILIVRVTTPENQSFLHRHLARLGYTAELIEEGKGFDVYRFVHPDGEQP